MNFINRAIKNVTRKLSKSVLMCLTFFVIGNLVIIGLGINNAAEQAKILTRQKMNAVISYEVNYTGYWNYVDELTRDMTMEERDAFYSSPDYKYPSITLDNVRNMLTDERVKTVNYLMTNQLNSVGFDPVPLGNEREANPDRYGGGYSSWCDDSGCYQEEYKEPNIAVMANMFPGMIEIENGQYEILDGGRFYTQEEIDKGAPVCLVTKELAELNNIRVGDTITIDTINPWSKSYYANAGVTDEEGYIDLEVIGIYVNYDESYLLSSNFQYMNTYDSPKNIILMPSTTLASASLSVQQKMWAWNAEQYPEETYYQDPDNVPTLESMVYGNQCILLITDPLLVDEFVEDHKPELAEWTKLNANNDTFKKLSRPLDTLSLFSNIIVWIVMFNAIVIITLITALTMKTREFEIGVLLSMGVTKAKIVGQFFLELLIVALIGFTLAAGSGSVIAGKVGDMMLNYQVTTEEQYTEDTDEYNGGNYYWFGNQNYFTEVSQEEMLAEYKVSVNPIIILTVYGLGIGVLFLSILVPTAMIMRFNPKKILTNMN